SLLNLEPGDEFEIKLGRKQIRLVPAGAVDEEE
ncbi:MAG: AbrB family transcriptional regulator, partial [Cyanobacteria bacterium WB6_1B_304]|nr:AbrB family transcriptional regulator [Cyanobacteria bacterium WB6_1B_304]